MLPFLIFLAAIQPLNPQRHLEAKKGKIIYFSLDYDIFCALFFLHITFNRPQIRFRKFYSASYK